MAGALIGLLGVLVGGVLAGIVNVAVERARERDRGMIAASILRDEIQAALSSLESAKKTRTWWPLAATPTLPAAWERHGAEFRFVAKPEACEAVRSVVALVAKRQADVVDRATRKAQRLATPAESEVLPETVVVELETTELSESKWEKDYKTPFEAAAGATNQLKPSWNQERVLGALAMTVIVGVLVWQLSAPVYTADAVARALSLRPTLTRRRAIQSRAATTPGTAI